jgi:hypothetical protein
LKRLKIAVENSSNENLPSCEVLAQAGKACVECNEFGILEALAEVGLSLDEQNIEMIYLRAFALARLGHSDEALDAVQGLLLFELTGELREAAEELQKSLTN